MPVVMVWMTKMATSAVKILRGQLCSGLAKVATTLDLASVHSRSIAGLRPGGDQSRMESMRKYRRRCDQQQYGPMQEANGGESA